MPEANGSDASRRRPAGGDPAARRRRPTIDDVAERAGVSSAAVSFAMNGRPGVAEATRRRILDAAEELGWRPSAHARALTEARARAVGLLLSRPVEQLEIDPFFVRFLAGVERTLARSDHALVLRVMDAAAPPDLGAYLRLAASGRVDGFLLCDVELDDPRFDLLAGAGLPVVVAGHPVSPCPFPAVETEHAQGMAAVAAHLVELGHEHVAFVGGPPRFEHVQRRLAVWRDTLAAAGLEPGPVEHAEPGGPAAAPSERLLAARPRPTAIVYGSDVLAAAGLAAARARVRAGLLGGAYLVTLAAVDRRDTATAERWLLLREFRRTTRFTRPGVDATKAVRDLGRGRGSPRAAALAVKKDLLDAYQARLIDALNDAEAADERDFAPRRAEESALAAGYWLILADEHRRQLGAAESRQAASAFAALDTAGAEGGARFGDALGRARDVLHDFTAAPFTPAEQARRANQLLRFLELVPVEYERGVEGRRVTKAFEIQEAIAFRDGAESAFTDLEAALSRRGARDAATAKAGLEQLERQVEDAGTGARVATKEEVAAVYGRAKGALERAMPESWKEPTDEADFDLIDLTLDRVDAAISAGEWKQAEQARLEAYAFIEFGPELRLRAFDPQLAADIEGLIWFGARGHPGLAKLISSHAPRTETRETRLALDEALQQAKETLGDESSDVTVAVNAAVIVFREGLEAVLILAAITASLLGVNARLRRPVLLGALLGLPASALMWVLAQTVLESLSRYGEKLEAVVGLIAVAVLLVVMNWFLHRVYWTGWIQKHHARRRRLLQVAGGGLLSAQVLGLAMLGFTSVFREGFETVLFLQALELSAGPVVVLEGVMLGLLATAAVAALTFVIERRLPYKKMLIVTGVLIGFVLVVMVGTTVRTMQGVGWVPITSLDVQIPYWAGLWFGVYPTVETVVAQVAAAAFVIGSYFLAERMRKPGRRGAPVARDGRFERAPAGGRNGSKEEQAAELETQRR